MSIRIKPLLYIFIVILIVFASVGYVISNTILPAKEQALFTELEKSSIDVTEDINEEIQKISFTVKGNFTLSEAVLELNQLLNKTDYVNYQLAVHSSNESEQLVQAWQHLQYDIYEIMGQKKFTDIPELSTEFYKLYPNIKLSISMNEDHVFVTLSSDENQLHRLLPINTSQVGMWG